MKLLVLSAAGKSGARLVAAAMQAGHTVTAFARDREKLFSRLPVQPGLIVKIGDVTNETLLGEAMAGQDAVINAAGNASDGPIFATLVQTVIAAAERALAPGGRLWLFGGAGVLTVPGTTLLGVDLFGFPAIYQAHRKNYDAVRATRLDWSMLCPGPMIAAPDGRAHDGLRQSADTLPFLAGDGPACCRGSSTQLHLPHA